MLTKSLTLESRSYIVFLVLGVIFISITLLHHKLAGISHVMDGVFLLLEAVCLAVIAVDYFHAGKTTLPLCYVFSTVMYVIVAFIKYKKNKPFQQSGEL